MVSTLTDTRTYFLRGSWHVVLPPVGTRHVSSGTGDTCLDVAGGGGDLGLEQWSRTNLTMLTVCPSILSVMMRGYFSKLISRKQFSR